MSHRCIHCMKVYSDSECVVLSGCACGSKTFFYVRDSKLPAPQVDEMNLPSVVPEIEDSADFSTQGGVEDISLDDETRLDGPIKSNDDGITVNVKEILHKDDVVYSSEEGKYTINRNSVFSGQRPKF